MALTRSVRSLAPWVLTAAVSATPAAANTVTTLEPTDDTYVRGGSQADANFNASPTLRVKNASGDTYDRKTLIRFDLSGTLGSVLSATLNLYCNDLSNGTPSAVFVYSVDDDSWQEDVVTWNTAPTPNSLLDSHTDISVIGATYSFDVTSFVAQELAGDAIVSLLLSDDLEVKRMADFDRRDDPNSPTLVIETQAQFALSVIPSGAGVVTLSPPGGVYDAGTVITMTAEPDPGWQFMAWGGDLAGPANPTTISMDTTRTVLAEFQPQYVLALSVNGLGSVTLNPPGGAYDAGTNVTLTAVPAPGWSFAGWSGDLTGQTNPGVVNMDADKALGAGFASGPPVTGNVVFQEDKNGGASNSAQVSTGNELVGVDGDLYLAAVAAQPHQPVIAVSGLGLSWSLVHEQCAGRGLTGVSLWKAQGTTTGVDIVSAQLATAAENVAIAVARYAGVDTIQPLGALVSANTNGTAAACSAGTDTTAYSLAINTVEPNAVVFGAVAHLDATHWPASGWTEREEFHHGVGTQASVSMLEHAPAAPGTVTWAGSLSVAVDWAAIGVEIRPGPENALALSTTGLGSVTLDPSGGSYPVDTIVSMTAAAEPGWWFVGWGETLNGHANPMSVLMSEDVQVSATFSSVPHYDLSLALSGIGNVVVDPPELRYATGTPVTLTAEIPPGWIFTGWGGDASGAAPSTSFIMTADRSVSADFRFISQRPSGLWTSALELASAPDSGQAWNQVLTEADQSFFPPDVADQNSPHNVRCLAAAIVYARTGDTSYRDRVQQALDYLSGLGHPGSTTLAWAREVGAYALAADLVGYRSAAFDTWLSDMAETYVGSNGRTVLETFEERPNNWGTHAFGMLVSVYAYLLDDAKLTSVRDAWVQGVTGTPPNADFGELSWHYDPARPRQINPPRASRLGLDIDGAMTDDVRRGGRLAIPPNPTGYPWEALQGIVMAARVLERYDPNLSIWYVGEKAIHRAARLLQVTWEQEYGGWAATGDDMWMLPFLDRVYGTTWSTGADDEFHAGKNVGWAYVLAGSTGTGPTTSTVSSNTLPYRLYPGLPNPFSTRTDIRFSMPTNNHIRLGVYDVLGRRVATLFHGYCPPGLQTVRWDGVDSSGRRVASGVYWCQLEVGARRERIRLVLVR